MKKIIILSLLVLLSPMAVLALDCPYGEIDCEGKCGAFIDSNSDGLCDYSQTADEKTELAAPTPTEEGLSGQQIKTMTVIQVAAYYQIPSMELAEVLTDYYKTEIKTSDKIQDLHDNIGLEPSLVKDLAVGIVSDTAKDVAKLKQEQSKAVNSRTYPFVSVAAVLILAYVGSLLLVRYKKISVLLQRRIWNVILTIFFLGVGLSGLFLVLRINYGLIINWPFNLLYWHVETGIIMAVISIFHALWHWPYYRQIFIRK